MPDEEGEFHRVLFIWGTVKGRWFCFYAKELVLLLTFFAVESEDAEAKNYQLKISVTGKIF